MPAKIIITGGAGFVGSQLGQRLAREGAEVVLLDNMSFGHLDNLIVDGATFGRLVCKDIRDPSTAQLYEGADCVVHLAGIAALPVCQSDPREAYDVNVGGTGAVLEAARRAGVRRVIFSSTSAVYENTEASALREDHSVRPDLVYACTKEAAEAVCRGYAKNYGMDVIVCRFFNVFGPHQDIHRTSPPFTSYVARELVHDRAPTLFNNTDARRDYVHVSDVIELLRLMMDAEGRYAAEVFNICSGAGYSVPELYETFRQVSGKSVAPVYDDPAKFWDKYPALFSGSYPLGRERIVKEVYKNAVGDPQKAQAAFGWTARTNMQEGLRSVYLDAERRFAGHRAA
jgi:nucleoside-diphosphate-sugar epimerase